MRHLTSTLLRGLGVILPVVLTAWIIIWLAVNTEALLKPVFELLLPQSYYLPGLGLIFGLLIIYATGIVVQLFIVKRLWEALERIFERIPLVKTLYTAISDFLEFFSRPKSEGSTVVSVDMGNDALLIGFVTDDSPATTLNIADGLVTAGKRQIVEQRSIRVGIRRQIRIGVVLVVADVVTGIFRVIALGASLGF